MQKRALHHAFQEIAFDESVILVNVSRIEEYGNSIGPDCGVPGALFQLRIED
jgi:hypothetical protein